MSSDPRARERAPRSDRLALVFVLAVWLALTLFACAYLARVTRPIPFADDLEYATLLSGQEHVSWRLVWAQANEHRLPLARGILFGLVRAGADLRAGCYAQIALQALLALGLVLLARALRGRTSVCDAFFPLLLVHIGDPENL